MKNFGQNVSFNPKHFYQPANETEVLDILNRHQNNKIRVRGSLHAWSDAAASNDVFIDLCKINKIEIIKDEDGTSWVKVGGGCVLKRLIEILQKENLMVPAMGGIEKQTIAGLISTATHGTGRSSLSHYMDEVSIATYDRTNGSAKIYEFNSGQNLKAARCAIGCMGVIISAKFKCVPRYWVTETIQRHKTIQDVLAQEAEYPLQQSGLFPYLWEFVSFQRKLSPAPSLKEQRHASIMRIADYLGVEILPHLLIKLLLILPAKKKIITWYYRSFLPSLVQGNTVINRDSIGLTLHTLHHYTFRHVEMEVFIPEKNLTQAIPIIKALTDYFAGINNDLPPEIIEQAQEAKLSEDIKKLHNNYLHHYPIFIRKVFPDDTLMSMSSGNEAYYALGFFTYNKESKRQSYYSYCYIMAKVLNRMFDARLHWGKYFPLGYEDISRVYPELSEFKSICQNFDSKGVFRNNFTDRVFGLKLSRLK